MAAMRAWWLPFLALLAAVASPATAAAEGRIGLGEAQVARGQANLIDSDGDGLSNWTEVHRTRTNPHKFDTDGDGFGDGAEVAAGSDPRNRASVPSPIPSP